MLPIESYQEKYDNYNRMALLTEKQKRVLTLVKFITTSKNIPKCTKLDLNYIHNLPN